MRLDHLLHFIATGRLRTIPIGSGVVGSGQSESLLLGFGIDRSGILGSAACLAATLHQHTHQLPRSGDQTQTHVKHDNHHHHS